MHDHTARRIERSHRVNACTVLTKSMNSLRSDYGWFCIVIVFRWWMTMKSRSSNRFIQISHLRSLLRLFKRHTRYIMHLWMTFNFISYHTIFGIARESKLFSHLISGSLFRRRFSGGLHTNPNVCEREPKSKKGYSHRCVDCRCLITHHNHRRVLKHWQFLPLT